MNGPIRGPGIGRLCLGMLANNRIMGTRAPVAGIDLSMADVSFNSFPRSRGRRHGFALAGAKRRMLIVCSIVASYKYAGMGCGGRNIHPKRGTRLAIVCRTRGTRRFDGAIAVCYGTSGSPLHLGMAKGTRWEVGCRSVKMGDK